RHHSLIVLPLPHTILILSLFLLTPPPPTSTLFPYTTLFRSRIANIERGYLTLGAGDPAYALSDDIDTEFGFEHDETFENGKAARSEEHTSELQSRSDLVCRLLLEKKKKMIKDNANKKMLEGS